MTCPQCGATLRWHILGCWLRCPECRRWQIPSGMPLARTKYERTGSKDDEPLCPDPHAEGE